MLALETWFSHSSGIDKFCLLRGAPSVTSPNNFCKVCIPCVWYLKFLFHYLCSQPVTWEQFVCLQQGKTNAPVSLNLLFLKKKVKFIYLFIYFGLCWVFISAHGLSLVAASRGYSSLRCTSFSLQWLLLWSTGYRRTGFSSCGTWAQQLWLTGSRVQAR